MITVKDQEQKIGGDRAMDGMLVGWESESEPMVVAVIGATMDTLGRRDSVDEAEASDIATDDLDEIGWFSEGPADPDHVVRV
jgi:hypothetical protein